MKTAATTRKSRNQKRGRDSSAKSPTSERTENCVSAPTLTLTGFA